MAVNKMKTVFEINYNID